MHTFTHSFWSFEYGQDPHDGTESYNRTGSKVMFKNRLSFEPVPVFSRNPGVVRIAETGHKKLHVRSETRKRARCCYARMAASLSRTWVSLEDGIALVSHFNNYVAYAPSVLLETAMLFKTHRLLGNTPTALTGSVSPAQWVPWPSSSDGSPSPSAKS